MKNLYYILILTTLGLVLPSCRGVKEVTYFQIADTTANKKNNVVYPNFISKDPNKAVAPKYVALIQPNDILSIYVTSLSPEASSFFNTIVPGSGPTADNFSTKADIGYLVDSNGFIEMPLVGKVKVEGLSTTAAHDTLINRLEKYLQSPSLRVYIVNFKVTVLGEVGRPGVYNVTNEKINLLEAIALAGDLTIFGSRQDVLLIREVNGEKTYTTIDLTKRDLFNADYYNLHSNDILYVHPIKGKVSQTDNFYRIFPIIVSSLTLIALLGFRFIN